MAQVDPLFKDKDGKIMLPWLRQIFSDEETVVMSLCFPIKHPILHQSCASKSQYPHHGYQAIFSCFLGGCIEIKIVMVGNSVFQKETEHLKLSEPAKKLVEANVKQRTKRLEHGSNNLKLA